MTEEAQEQTRQAPPAGWTRGSRSAGSPSRIRVGARPAAPGTGPWKGLSCAPGLPAWGSGATGTHPPQALSHTHTGTPVMQTPQRPRSEAATVTSGHSAARAEEHRLDGMVSAATCNHRAGDLSQPHPRGLVSGRPCGRGCPAPGRAAPALPPVEAGTAPQGTEPGGQESHRHPRTRDQESRTRNPAGLQVLWEEPAAPLPS